ncbi:hypothetical protein JCM3765_000079 [Sporobolomyces pararoseus]
MSTLFPSTRRQTENKPALPDLPQTGPSFSDEVQQGMQKRLSNGSQLGPNGSILFPSTSANQPTTTSGGEHSRRESEDEGAKLGSMLFPPVPLRRRSQSSPAGRSASNFRNSTASTLLPYDRDDGNNDEDDGEDEDEEEEDLDRTRRTAGTARRGIQNRASKVQHSRNSSTYSNGGPPTSRRRAATETTTALDYLMMEERDREERAIDETPRTRNKRLALIQEKKQIETDKLNKRLSGQGNFDSPTDSRGSGFYNGEPSASNGVGGGAQVREDQQYSREEAWYLLRALVGQEITHEEGLLWKLQNLDPREDLFGENTYEESIPPTELPILRYLIKHFLLTLPLVRDVTSPTGVPSFWTEGLFPIIRAVHNADFSQPIDRNGASGVPSPHDSTLRNALERFVSAGLKISSTSHLGSASDTPEFTSDAEATGAAMMDRLPTNSTARYNFQPTAPPPEVTPPLETVQDPISRSSSNKRFSFSRLFNGSGTPSSPLSKSDSLNLGPAVTSVPSSPPKEATKEATEPSSPVLSSSSSWQRLSHVISLPPPVPHVFPNRPDPSRSPSVPRPASQEPESPIVNSQGTFEQARPSTNLSRQASTSSRARRAETESIGFTSGLEDGASFVSAREANTTEGGESDFEVLDRDENEMEELTARMPEPLQSSVGMSKQKSEGEKTISKGEKEEEVEGYTVDGVEPAATRSGGSSTPSASTPTTSSPAPPVQPPFQNYSSPARQSPSPSSPSSPEKRSSKFGLASLLRNKRSRTKTSDSAVSATGPSPQPGVVPSSRQVPLTTTTDSNFVAHMAIPNSLMWTSQAQGSTSGSDYPLSPARSGAPIILDKGGSEWPFQEDVEFEHGPDFELLKWGGFEADVVGVRRTIFSVNYIIRVRRPARLDEFVLRTESQFIKFWRTLDKSFPNAHIRRIPAGDPKNDVIIRPRPSLPALGSTPTLVSGMQSTHSLASTTNGRSRFLSGMQQAAADPHNPERPTPPRSSSAMSSSNFTRSLRAQSLHSEGEIKAVRARRVRSATFSSAQARRPGSAFGSYRSFGATSVGSRLNLPVEIGKKMPTHDQRRRALRSWLRDVLSVRTVGHNLELAKFLLSGSEVPKDSDVLDIAKRELIDEARRSARLGAAQAAVEKVRTLRNYWDLVEEEIIHADGLAEISSTLREVPAITKLPLKYQKVIELVRFDFAETLFETLVSGPSSGVTFAKLKSLHAAFPYFLVRQALRLGGSKLMARALQDILVSRPFGGKSLLQKILATCLDDDPVRLAAEMDRCRARIGSNVMCEKLEQFVRDSREKKTIIRRYAEENNIELVLCIVRGADEPRLPAYLLTRIRKSQVAYRKFAKTNPSPLMKAQVQDPDIRLVLELQTYLRLASRDRDAAMMREMLANEDFAAAIEIVAEPFIALLKRTYRIGNAAQLLSDVQTFLNQLIIIVEALRSRIQDPQKSIRVLARLLSRHDQSLYTFIRSVHRKETIVEEFLQWLWTASVFLRRGLAEPVNIDEVVPPNQPDEKAYLLDELEELTGFHADKRFHAFQSMCRRLGGDVQEDSPITVEGDGRGKSRIEPILDPKPSFPPLSEIPIYASAFKNQLKSVFAF